MASDWPTIRVNARLLVRVLRRPGMVGGLLATILIFSGHFALFTYLRPFLETVGQVSVETISLILLGFGVANFVGTSIAGPTKSKSTCRPGKA